MCNEFIVFNYSFSLASLRSLPNHKSFDGSDNESDGPTRSTTTTTTTNKNSKKRGRRGNRTSECLYDFIVIIISDEYFKKKLIFTNTKNQKNALIYEKVLKCHCNEKIFDPILSTTEQHFHTSLNGVFSFSISCFVLEILRFFETCKLSVSDVIYSRIINCIYQMVNIFVNSTQKFFKLYMPIAIW